MTLARRIVFWTVVAIFVIFFAHTALTIYYLL